MNEWNLQLSEIILYISLFIAIVALLLLFYNILNNNHDEKKLPIKKNPTNQAKPKEEKKKNKKESNVVEVFDYLGTKIIHDNGHYTVNHQGLVQNYSSWLDMPEQFKKMVKEIDKRSLGSKSNNDYFLEIINGAYYVTTPGGKKRKYRSMKDIPEHIRKVVGKV